LGVDSDRVNPYGGFNLGNDMAGAKSDSTGSLTHFTLDGIAAF